MTQQESASASDGELILQVSSPIDEQDVELFTMYLENRKQSGGGDIKRRDYLNENKTLLKVEYESPEAKDRVLSGRFFSFLNDKYYLLATKTGRGYCDDDYPLVDTKLVITNVTLDLTQSVDYELLKMYAEYLDPNNDVLRVDKSKVFTDVYYVTYESPFDKRNVLERLCKKPKLKNSLLNVLDVRRTNALVVTSSLSDVNVCSSDLDAIKSQILALIAALDEKVRFFVDLSEATHFIFLFETIDSSEFSLQSLIDKIEPFLNEKFNCKYAVESVANFQLIDGLNRIVKDDSRLEIVNNTSNTTDQNGPKPATDNRTVEKATQTDLTSSDIDKLLNKTNSSSVQSTCSSSSSSLATQPKPASTPTVDNVNSIILDTNEYYTIAFSNAKQLFLNFNDFLNAKYRQLKLTLVENDNKLVLQSRAASLDNDQWKPIIDDFFSKRANYVQIPVPDKVANNPDLINFLQNALADLNKFYQATYFHIKNGQIHCYGTIKLLQAKTKELNAMIAAMMANKTPPKPVDPTITTPANGKKQPANGPVVELTNTTTASSKKQPANAPVLESTDSYWSIPIDKQNYSLIYECISNCGQILTDLKGQLSAMNFVLAQTDNRLFHVKGGFLPDDQLVTELVAKLKCYLTDYEESNLAKIKLEIPRLIRTPKEMSDLKNHIKRFFAANAAIAMCEVSKQNDTVTIYGYRKVVQSIESKTVAKFRNLENNIHDRIRKKCEVKISAKKKEYTVLAKFQSVYFGEFAAGLEKLHAAIQKPTQANNQTFLIKCTLSDEKIQSEQAVKSWNEKLKNYMTTFFNRFNQQKIQINGEHKLSELKAAKFDPKLVNISYLTKFDVEITGIKSEVERVVKLCTASNTSNNKLANNSPSNHSIRSDSDKPSSTAEDKFLIKDLKWFQTRILFEKKYFQYINESFKELKVLLDTQLTRVFFTGNPKDIELAKNLAFDILNQIMGCEFECSGEKLAALSLNETSIQNEIKQSGVCCVVDAKSSPDRYTVYATSLDEIEKCKAILAKLKL